MLTEGLIIKQGWKMIHLPKLSHCLDYDWLANGRFSEFIGLFHFLSVQGDGRKIPGLVKSMNFQWSTARSPKFQGVGNIFQQNS